jgi:hypothetical protein
MAIAADQVKQESLSMSTLILECPDFWFSIGIKDIGHVGVCTKN